jgi:Ca2+-binding RTX toxin-like protein
MHPNLMPLRASTTGRLKALAAGGLVAAGLAAAAQPAHAAYAVGTDHKTLLVSGDGAADKLALRLAPDAKKDVVQVDVGDDGKAEFQVRTSKIDRIVVNAGAGDDTVRIDDSNGVFTDTIPTQIDGGDGDDAVLGGAGAETLDGGAGNDTVDGNGGADTALLGAGDDTFVWDPGDGSDVVDGQAGSDSLAFNGSSGDEKLALTADGARARLTRNLGAVAMDLDGIERVGVAAVGGSDTLTVGPLAGTAVQNVDNDTGGDGAADQTIVTGTDGADTIAATGTADGATVGGTGVAVTTTHSEADDVVSLQGAGGDDTLSAPGILPTVVTIAEDGGAGDDTLVGGNGDEVLSGGDGNDSVDGNRGADTALLGAGDDTFQWDPGDGSDTVEGQDGRDAMAFNGSNIGEEFTVTADGPRVRFARNVAGIVMDLAGVEEIDTAAFRGADLMTIGDLTGTDVTELRTDLGALRGGPADGEADRIVVAGTAGNDAITAAGSAGTLAVTGLPARVDVTGAEAPLDVLDIDGGAGDDAITGGDLTADAIGLNAEGGDGDDVLTGGAGDDTLAGGPGDDVLNGGPGQDVLDGGPGANVLIQ